MKAWCAIAICSTLAACAAPGPGSGWGTSDAGSAYGSMEIRRGVIENIAPVEIASDHHAGLGAILGGVAGLGLGSLVGRGTGRDVAMVAGALGGGLLGNEAQKRYEQPQYGQQILVRLANGVLISVTQPGREGLWVGQPVYVEGQGQGARVVPR